MVVSFAEQSTVLFDIFGDGLETRSGERGQRQEQNDQKTFAEFAKDDSQHFDSFNAASHQFNQSKAVQSSHKLINQFLQ